MLVKLVDISDDPWGDDRSGSNSLQHHDPFASIDTAPPTDPWLPPPPTSNKSHLNTSGNASNNHDPWKTNNGGTTATNPWSSVASKIPFKKSGFLYDLLSYKKIKNNFVLIKLNIKRIISRDKI